VELHEVGSHVSIGGSDSAIQVDTPGASNPNLKRVLRGQAASDGAYQ
jgi:hypothetical protein